MIRALLVDLDDTLLENDLSRFLPVYFDLLATGLSEFGPKDEILKAVLVGTRAMLENDDPSRTLAQAFYDAFGAATGATPDEIAPTVEHFYAQVYPRLSGLTTPKTGAPELLNEAVGLGLDLAVATNPLMTRHAIEQRLRWAGVPPEQFDFALVTDVESFHFAKPRLAYYAEALARLGLLPGEALMIGNDPDEDLAPASALGIPVFHILGELDPRFPGGSLGQARAWLATQASTSAPPVLDPPALIARLEGQLAALLGRLALADAGATSTPGGARALTPLQVVCHLRDVDREVNQPRLEQILARENPFFSAVDTDAWLVDRGYEREPIETAVAGMVETRRQVLDILRRLEPDQWRRPARHALLGPITLAEWVAVLAEHDLRHQAGLDGRLPAGLEGGKP